MPSNLIRLSISLPTDVIELLDEYRKDNHFRFTTEAVQSLISPVLKKWKSNSNYEDIKISDSRDKLILDSLARNTEIIEKLVNMMGNMTINK